MLNDDITIAMHTGKLRALSAYTGEKVKGQRFHLKKLEN